MQSTCRCSTKLSPQLPWIVSDFYSSISATCMWVGYNITRNTGQRMNQGIYTGKKKRRQGRKEGRKGRREERDTVSHQLPWIKCFIESAHRNWHHWIWGSKMTANAYLSCTGARWLVSTLGVAASAGAGTSFRGREGGKNHPASHDRASATHSNCWNVCVRR